MSEVETKPSDDVLNILETEIQDGETQLKKNTYELHFLEKDGNYSKVKLFQDHPSNCAVKKASANPDQNGETIEGDAEATTDKMETDEAAEVCSLIFDLKQIKRFV